MTEQIGRRVEEHTPSLAHLEALYNINRYAHRYNDLRKAAERNDNSRDAEAHTDTRNALYTVKERAIQSLVDTGAVDYVTRECGGDGELWLVSLTGPEGATWSFHVPVSNVDIPPEAVVDSPPTGVSLSRTDVGVAPVEHDLSASLATLLMGIDGCSDEQADTAVVSSRNETATQMKAEALANIRDALAAVTKVPAAGLSGDQHELLAEAFTDIHALERMLQTELEQKRGRG